VEIYVGDTWIPNDTLTECVTTEKINCAGSLKFTVTTGFAPILEDKKIITMLDDGETVFRGRVLSATEKMSAPMPVVCEGELAFFCDSTVVGSFHGEIEDVISSLIELHNSRTDAWQHITEGDLNSSGNEFIVGEYGKRVQTMEMLQNAIAMEPDYFLFFENGELNYDLVTSQRYINRQEIRFGENLISFRRQHRFDDIVTRVYAYGTTQTGEHIQIGYVDADAEAIARYGIISKRIDVNADSEEELERLARSALCTQHHDNIEIEAFDRHWIDRSIPRFRPRAVVVRSQPDGYYGSAIIREVTQDWLHPEKNQIRIGADFF
jgi:hypothetical protein